MTSSTPSSKARVCEQRLLPNRRQSVTSTADVATSVVTSFGRMLAGMTARPAELRPEKPLELYEFEACPYCRLVREALTALDLGAMIYPCPKGGVRFRPQVKEMGGKFQFPFLVDPNTATRMYESADIVDYLYRTYGRRESPRQFVPRRAREFASIVSGVPRMTAGSRARPSIAPEQPLELYSFEASPFARLAREMLCELEIPYLLHNVGRMAASDFVPPFVRERMGVRHDTPSENRQALAERAGKVMVPYLVDPNTGAAMFQSADIRRYLMNTYGRAEGSAAVA